MALSVRRSGGVVVEYAGEGVVFDPTSGAVGYPALVSHAHGDHSAAFRYPDLIKYSTEPTYRLLEALGWSRRGEWRSISVGDSVRFGEIDVRVHNAGHILGSTQFEAATPEGIILYTGDFGLGDSYTMEGAKPVGCDLLVIETTFGAPMFTFPRRREVGLQMIRWAVHEAIPAGRVPAFRADSIGNAQEIISIFNGMTKLPVVTTKSVTRVSDVYKEHGHRLDYVDAESEEGREYLDSGRCVLVAPKGSKLKREGLDLALATGWAVIMRRRGRSFPLSDHVDFRGLLSFIRRCHPKRVLTFHGGALTKDFANYVKRRLGIDARPLTGREETMMGPISNAEVRMRACCEQLLRTVRIPGFVYTSPWLVREMARGGFTRSETEAAILRLVDRSVLETTERGVKLT
jgi:putative mRNA 3-end processing factor